MYQSVYGMQYEPRKTMPTNIEIAGGDREGKVQYLLFRFVSYKSSQTDIQIMMYLQQLVLSFSAQ